MKVRFSHLSLSERRKIERWRQTKLSPDEMARRLGRHGSTILRELRRNHVHDSAVPKLSGYWCVVAQSFSDGRRTRQRKLVRDTGLRDQVERCLRSGWTPEQIAGRMRYKDAPRRVCQETIYRHVYSDEGRRAELWRHLPSGRRRRRGYRLRKRPPPKFAPELSILFRPDVIAHRKQFGHWGETGPSRPMARRKPVERSGAVPAEVRPCQCHQDDRAHQPFPGRVEERRETHQADHGAG
ncbi:IS30 family transposase [Paracoccus yeei]|uniref:IS30 family transposase n=1 Tax=Paracoccus yeei TaxID=147645 RepID=UPI0037CE8797